MTSCLPGYLPDPLIDILTGDTATLLPESFVTSGSWSRAEQRDGRPPCFLNQRHSLSDRSEGECAGVALVWGGAVLSGQFYCWGLEAEIWQ